MAAGANPQDLQALLALMAQSQGPMSRARAAVQPQITVQSPLGVLAGLPQLSALAAASPITPEEMAALKAADKKPTQDTPASISGLLNTVGANAEKEAKEGEGLFGALKMIFGGSAAMDQARGEASGAQAQADAVATANAAVPNQPETYGPPIPPGGTYGPEVPTLAEVLRYEARKELGLDPVTGAPPSGGGAPGTPGPNTPLPMSQDPMQSDAYPLVAPTPENTAGRPPLTAVEAGTRAPFTKPGSEDVMGPAVPTKQEYLIDALYGMVTGRDAAENSAARAFYEGRYGDILPTWLASTRRGIEDIRKAGEARYGKPEGGSGESGGPAPAFTYSFSGASPTGAQTREVNIDAQGNVTQGGAEAKPQAAAQPSGNLTLATIKQFEGFRDEPYWDVDHWRVGYGSDTITDAATGQVRVTRKGEKITQADADADLARRAKLFQDGIVKEVPKFHELPENVKAGLTSVAYNYGSLPQSVVVAANTGDPVQIASAVQGLAGHNNGVNANRRAKEAALILGDPKAIPTATSGGAHGMPGYTPREITVLPPPPQMAAAVGPDYDKILAAIQAAVPKKMDPLSGGDALTAILAGMARGAASAPGSDWGRVIAGLGAGAAGAAGELTALERGDTKEYNDATSRHAMAVARGTADAEVGKANLKNENASIDFKNRVALWETAVKNAGFAREERNAMRAYQDKIDWKAWELGQPQITATEKGFTVITRKPDGSMNMKVTSYADFDNELKKIDQMGDVLGKDATATQLAKAQALAKTPMGELGIRRMLLGEALKSGGLGDVVGKTNAEALTKEIDKGIPDATTLRATDRKEYDRQFQARALDILTRNMGEGKLDDGWIERLAKNGNPVAMLMVQNAKKKQAPPAAPTGQDVLNGGAGQNELKGGGGGDYLDTREFLANGKPDQVLPFDADTSGFSQEEYNIVYGEKGKEVTKRVFDKEGFDQWGRDKKGYSREDKLTPGIDYGAIAETKGKPLQPFDDVKVHEDDAGNKVAEVFESKGADLKSLQEKAVKEGNLKPGDKVLVRDAKGNTFWFTYSPNDPGGRADGAGPNDPVKYKFAPWQPPTAVVSEINDDFFGPKKKSKVA